MTLKPGKYIISNKSNDLYLGRGVTEETSLLPKSIVTLPGGVRAPEWKAERLEDGRYKLGLLHANSPLETYVAEIKGKVYAILDPQDPVKPTEWTLKHAEGHGPHVYVIEAPSGKVWVIPEEEPYTQVIVDNIIVLSAEDEVPPLYSPRELFTFSPVPEDKCD